MIVVSALYRVHQVPNEVEFLKDFKSHLRKFKTYKGLSLAPQVFAREASEHLQFVVHFTFDPGGFIEDFLKELEQAVKVDFPAHELNLILEVLMPWSGFLES